MLPSQDILLKKNTSKYTKGTKGVVDIYLRGAPFQHCLEAVLE